MVEVCLGFLVDIMFYVKWLAKLNIFVILVLVNKFVVVAILSEWWSRPTTADHCGHIPAHVQIQYIISYVRI